MKNLLYQDGVATENVDRNRTSNHCAGISIAGNRSDSQAKALIIHHSAAVNLPFLTEGQTRFILIQVVTSLAERSVELMNHLAFVEWKTTGARTGDEQAAIVCHVELAGKDEIPGSH